MQKTRTLRFLSPVLFALMLASLSPSGLAQSTGLNIVLELRGEVWIKKTGRNNPQRASLGNLLNPSDRVRLGRGASLKVRCDNLFIWELRTAGEFPVSSGCPAASSPRASSNQRSPTRSAQNSNTPYLISPRDTYILTQKPTLRWNPVEGATSYRVRVFGEGLDWSETVNRPEIAYSGRTPLQTDELYWITVIANTQTSKTEESAWFKLLEGVEAQRVAANRAQIQQQPLNAAAKTLALAYLYQSYDLNDEGIALLEDAIAKGEQTPAVYHLLGNLYFNVGLDLWAAERYLTALDLMKAEENLEAQAEIQENLGEIEEGRERLKEAVKWYREAQQSYRQLGDEDKVQELQNQLNDLDGRILE